MSVFIRGKWTENILTSIELGLDTITDEQRDAAAALLVEGNLQSLRNGVFTGVVETSEKDDEALLRSWRVTLTESLYDRTVVSLSTTALA